MTLCLPASAADVELEGPIQNVDPPGRTITVMDIVVQVPVGIPINSPTAAMTLQDMHSEAPALPDRSVGGFIGGTATIVGTSDINGIVSADDLFAEPAENVILGELTEISCATPACNSAADILEMFGTPLKSLTDSRIPAGPPVSADNGFILDLRRVISPIPAAAEGYFAAGRLHFFALEIETGTDASVLLNAAITEVSIQRAQCRNDEDGAQFKLRGATHVPRGQQHPEETRVIFSAEGQVIGSTETEPEFDEVTDLATEFGSYRFREEGAPGSVCPEQITATYTANGITATTSVAVDSR